LAGFDFVVPTASYERVLAKLILFKLQRAASEVNVVLRFRWNGLSNSISHEHYYITVDGNFPNIQILLKQSGKYFQGFSDGYVAASSDIRKTRIGELIVMEFASAILDFQDDLNNLSTDINQYISPKSPITFNSFIFNFTESSGLSKSGKSLTKALLNYFVNSLSTEQLAEQLHTTSEHAMNYLLGNRARKMSFQELIDACPMTDEHKRALTELKSLRREAKHRGKEISDNDLEVILSKCVAAIHSLAAFIHHLLANNSNAVDS
jgi:hypothetical protein